jgi:DNA-binding XRE family transcriptional regulator
MSKPQFIRTEAGEEFVVLSRRDYDAMRARLGDEDAEDRMTARIVKEAKASGGVAAPLSVWDEVEAASSPIGPLRKWRKLTQEELAAKAGISGLSVGTRERKEDLATLRRVAAALGVGLDDVTHNED